MRRWFDGGEPRVSCISTCFEGEVQTRTCERKINRWKMTTQTRSSADQPNNVSWNIFQSPCYASHSKFGFLCIGIEGRAVSRIQQSDIFVQVSRQLSVMEHCAQNIKIAVVR